MKKIRKQENDRINRFYIKGFDGLRAISIILVLLTHLGFLDSLLQNQINTRIWLCISGETGVNIFFTISGFLITILLIQEKAVTSSINITKFFARRFLRLLPPLIIFYATILVLMLFGNLNKNYFSLFVSFIYLYNFIPNKFYMTELGHTWSLGVEEQYYFIWPIVLNFFTQNKIILIMAGIIVSSIITILIIPNIEFIYNNELFIIGDKFRTQRFILPAISPIIIGSFFSIICYNIKDKISKLMNKPQTPLFALVLITSPLFIPSILFPFLMMIQAIGVSTILSFIFLNQNSMLTNFLEIKPIRFIGRISYGIYIWQGLFLRTGPGGNLWIQQFPQNIFLTFLVAILSYYTIEKYFRSWRLRMH